MYAHRTGRSSPPPHSGRHHYQRGAGSSFSPLGQGQAFTGDQGHSPPRHGNGRFHPGGDRARRDGPSLQSRGRESRPRSRSRENRFHREKACREGYPVTLNRFKLETTVPPEKCHDVIQYAVEIKEAYRAPRRDATGNIVEPEQFDILPKTNRETGDEKIIPLDESTPRSRRIILKLIEQLESEGMTLASDGSQSAYAPMHLFPSEDRANYKEYIVKLKLNCEDEKDPDVSRAVNKKELLRDFWFIIRLTKVGMPIPIHRVIADPTSQDNEQHHMRVSQCISTIFKSGMMASCIAPGRSPRNFYLPEDHQHAGLPGSWLRRAFHNVDDFPHAPFVGLSLSEICVCQDGVFLVGDLKVGFFNRKHSPLLKISDRRGTKISGTIAGVYVDDLTQPITDPKTKADIEAVLGATVFDVIYERTTSSQEWIKHQREIGHTDIEIKKRKERIFKHVRKTAGDGIVWAADDPTLHSFPHKSETLEKDNGEVFTSDPNKTYTVASYRSEICGAKVHFPKMPIVSTKYGWFAVEDLYYNFGKAKGANSQNEASLVLEFNDHFSGNSRMEQIGNLIRTMEELPSSRGMTLKKLLDRFHFRCTQEPQEQLSEMLAAVSLSLGGTERPSTADNGSWRFHHNSFRSPSDIYSFAALDLVGDSNVFLCSLLNTMKGHGMVVPGMFDDERVVEKLITNISRAEQIDAAFKRTVENAQGFLLHDEKGFFKNNSASFRTRATIRHGNVGLCKDCLLVFRNGKRDVLLPPDFEWATHKITSLKGEEGHARMVAVVNVDDASGAPVASGNIAVDLFQLQVHSSQGQVYHIWHQDKNAWIRVRFNRYVWCFDKEHLDKNLFVEGEDIAECCPCREYEDWQIECPAIVLVIMPDQSPDTHHLVKYLSHVKCGVQTQCVVKRRGEVIESPTLHNLAAQMNKKLFNTNNNALSWIACPCPALAWIGQCPTLVMSVATSHDTGENGKTAVAASACITVDGVQMAHELCIQSHSSIVAGRIMKEMALNLGIQFFFENGYMPMRVIVYRSGVSDEHFGRVRSIELPGIRKALCELHKQVDPGFNCNTCQNNGCDFVSLPFRSLFAREKLS